MKFKSRVLTYCTIVLLGTSIPTYGETLADVSEVFELEAGQTGGISEIWGNLDGRTNPWIETLTLGTIYLHPSSTAQGYWLWVSSLGWLYSSVDEFPKAYRYDSSGYIFLDLTSPTDLKYWDFSLRCWISEPKPGLGNLKLFGQVPANLQGIKAYDAGVGFSSGVSIGHYYLEYFSSSRATGVVKLFYYYNNNDDCFYPLFGSSSLTNPYKDLTFTLIEWGKIRIHKEGNNLVVVWLDRLWNTQDDERIFPISNE